MMMVSMLRREAYMAQNFRFVLQLLRPTKVESDYYYYGRFQRNYRIISQSKLASGYNYWMHPALQFFTTHRTITATSSRSAGVKNVNIQPPPSPQVPSSPSFFPNWLRWVLSSVLSLLLPFSWQKLRTIEEEAEIVVEGVDRVAKVVEKVANVAEKVAEDVAENVAEDSQLKKAALFAENVSKEVAHDAHQADQFIHKVDEVKNDLDDLGSIIHQFGKKESQRK